MTLTEFDRKILSKAMSILQREKEFALAEEVRHYLWKGGTQS